MVTVLLYALLAIGLAAGLFFLAVRFLPPGEQLAPVIPDEPLWMLPPDRTLDAEDVSSVRIPVALRGYRFAETDVLLDRLAEELRKRDEIIARLRGGTFVGDVAVPGDHPMLPYDDDHAERSDLVEANGALVSTGLRPERPQRAPAVPPPWWRAESEPLQGLIADPAGAPIVHRLDEAPTTLLPLAELAELEVARDEADAPVAPSRRRFGRRGNAVEAEQEQPRERRHRRESGAAAPPVLEAESGSWWSRLSGEESQHAPNPPSAPVPPAAPPQPPAPDQPPADAPAPPAAAQRPPAQRPTTPPPTDTDAPPPPGPLNWRPPPGADER